MKKMTRRMVNRYPHNQEPQLYNPPYVKDFSLTRFHYGKPRAGWVIQSFSGYVRLANNNGTVYSHGQLYIWEGKKIILAKCKYFADWPRMSEAELLMFELCEGSDLRVAIKWLEEIYEEIGEPKL